MTEEAPPVRTVNVRAYTADPDQPGKRRSCALLFYDDNDEMHPVVFFGSDADDARNAADAWWAKELEAAKAKWTARAIAIVKARKTRAEKAERAA